MRGYGKGGRRVKVRSLSTEQTAYHEGALLKNLMRGQVLFQKILAAAHLTLVEVVVKENEVMDMPTVDTSAEAYLPRSAYTISRVAADPKVAGREQALATAHTNLKAALRERDDLEEQVQKSAALFDAADAGCDDDVEGFELHLLAAVNKNRDNIKYKRYFAEGLRAVTTAEPRTEEPEIVGDMITSMSADANDADIGPVVTQWKSKLEAARANVIAADNALTILEKALANANEKKLPERMAAWRDEYKKLEGALITVYPTDAKRVGRFFKAFRKSRKGNKPQAPATPAPTP